MAQDLGFGTMTHVSATGLQTITSVSGGAALIGIMSHASATSAYINIFHGVTASVLACGTVVFASGSVANFLELPGHVSGGMTIDMGETLDPNVTLFWNPA
jgi:hypothetical protein